MYPLRREGVFKVKEPGWLGHVLYGWLLTFLVFFLKCCCCCCFFLLKNQKIVWGGHSAPCGAGGGSGQMADGSQSLQSSSLVYLSSEQFMPALDDEKWITLGSIPYRFVTPSPFLSRTETTVFRLHNPVISRKWEVRWQPFCGVLHPHQRQFYCFVQCLNLIFFSMSLLKYFLTVQTFLWWSANKLTEVQTHLRWCKKSSGINVKNTITTYLQFCRKFLHFDLLHRFFPPAGDQRDFKSRWEGDCDLGVGHSGLAFFWRCFFLTLTLFF